MPVTRYQRCQRGLGTLDGVQRMRAVGVAAVPAESCRDAKTSHLDSGSSDMWSSGVRLCWMAAILGPVSALPEVTLSGLGRFARCLLYVRGAANEGLRLARD
jgi:hypothetical protein